MNRLFSWTAVGLLIAGPFGTCRSWAQTGNPTALPPGGEIPPDGLEIQPPYHRAVQIRPDRPALPVPRSPQARRHNRTSGFRIPDGPGWH